ncbi:hypothetical protein SteCoe_31689 [Stentor coeruleus]|uniref:Mevalonate kinase n=1 Tax=Stentor coeruleus TaxID=5963 RepID=A0A1R2B0U5_9CILI|nr:hypothetical protein SteCoe_31689 [Stentor coeruleus]
MREIKVSVPGKVILTGEHAVVYGSLAVAASINIRMRICLKASESPSQISINFNELQETIEWSSLDDYLNQGTIPGVICTFVKEAVLEPCFLSFSIENDLPIGSGMGSSAAFCVGIAGVLLKLKNVDSVEDINKLAFKGENLIHGKASGIDNTVVAYGGLISYKQGSITHLPFPEKSLKIIVVDSKTPKNTKTMVSKVRSTYEKFPLIYSKIFESINSLSEAFIQEITLGNLDNIKELLRINHNLLRTIGVSCQVLDDCVNEGEKLGIVGKMTGGGGGGICVFINEGEDVRAFREKCNERGWGFMEAEFSRDGIRFEEVNNDN